MLADRVFCGYPLVAALTRAGADVLIRAKSQNLPVGQVLTDRSWLSVLPDPRASQLRSSRNFTRRRRGSPLGPDTSPLPGIPIRVIEFTLTVTGPDARHRSEPYRLITTMLDPARAPAQQLAECYAQRWEAETGYRELKTILRGAGRILRSRDPDMVRQEVWALLSACQLIHAARAAAAQDRTGLDPDRISYTVTLHAVRRQLTTGHRTSHRRAITSEILGQILPPRRPRSYPRLTRASTALRREASTQHHGPVRYSITITAPASTSQPGP